MQVWGEHYVKTFLSAALPSQLAEGNLRDFPWLSESIYEIYTTSEDAQIIQRSAEFRRLLDLVQVRFILVDKEMSISKWHVLRNCHRQAIKSADARHAALFFLFPDLVWSRGSFTNAARRIEAGHTAVLCPGPRANLEDFVPAVRQDFLDNDGITLGIPSRELVRLGIIHMHEETRVWHWDSPDYYKFPTYILFDVPAEGISAFCYILHPVVINAQVRHTQLRKIFDQDYLMAACPDESKFYVARDSDELCFFELSPRNMPLPPKPRDDLTPIKAMQWYGEYQYNHQHRRLVTQPIRLHYTECHTARWEEIEARGMEIIRSIHQGWEIPDGQLLWREPENLIRRIQGRYKLYDNKIIAFPDAVLLSFAYVLRTPSVLLRWLSVNIPRATKFSRKRVKRLARRFRLLPPK